VSSSAPNGERDSRMSLTSAGSSALGRKLATDDALMKAVGEF
jgi:hypothetical protein